MHKKTLKQVVNNTKIYANIAEYTNQYFLLNAAMT